MIVEPPFDEGALHVMVADVADATTAPVMTGVVGTPAGMMELDAGEAALVPTTLVAVTVNVYDVPVVRPVTVQVIEPVVVHVSPPGLDVTV